MKELILSAHKDLKAKNIQDAVYLGSWCFGWAGPDYYLQQKKATLATSPWSDLAETLPVSRTLEGVAEQLFRELVPILAAAQSTPKSQRFWKILVYPWLIHFVGQVYDRYERLKALAKSEEYFVRLPKKNEVRVFDSHHYIQLSTRDNLNLALFEDLLALGKLDKIKIQRTDLVLQTPMVSPVRGLRQSLNPAQFLSPRFSESFKTHEAFKLSSSLNFSSPYTIKKRPAVLQPRRFVIAENSSDAFLKILGQMLSKYIPEVFFEDFEVGGRSNFVGGNPLLSEDALRAACAAESGGKWVGIQHGAVYGQSLAFPAGYYEYQFSDRFVTWGWDKHIYPGNFVPLPSPQLSRGETRGEGAGIVFLGTLHPLYFYRTQSSLLPEDHLSYFENKVSFISKLGNHARSDLRIKISPLNFGIEEEALLRSMDAEPLKFFEGPALPAMTSAKLVVTDYMGTAMTESLSLNVPTVIFWSRKHFDVSPEAESVFGELKRVGIFHETPESCAEHINGVYADINRWWQSTEVQEVRANYCQLHGRSSPDYLSQWKDFLSSVI